MRDRRDQPLLETVPQVLVVDPHTGEAEPLAQARGDELLVSRAALALDAGARFPMPESRGGLQALVDFVAAQQRAAEIPAEDAPVLGIAPRPVVLAETAHQPVWRARVVADPDHTRPAMEAVFARLEERSRARSRTGPHVEIGASGAPRNRSIPMKPRWGEPAVSGAPECRRSFTTTPARTKSRARLAPSPANTRRSYRTGCPARIGAPSPASASSPRRWLPCVLFLSASPSSFSASSQTPNSPGQAGTEPEPPNGLPPAPGAITAAVSTTCLSNQP